MEEPAVSIFRAEEWRWGQHVPPKILVSTRLHSVTSQKSLPQELQHSQNLQDFKNRTQNITFDKIHYSNCATEIGGWTCEQTETHHVTANTVFHQSLGTHTHGVPTFPLLKIVEEKIGEILSTMQEEECNASSVSVTPCLDFQVFFQFNSIFYSIFQGDRVAQLV
jgi:hypothetical protein